MGACGGAPVPGLREIGAIALAAALGILGGAGPAAAEDAPPWPTHEFDIVLHSGGISGVFRDLFLRGLEEEALAQNLAVMKAYLADAAKELDRQGFRPPPLKRADGAYVVNLYDYEDSLAPARAVFAEGTCSLEIDSSRAFVEGRLADRLLENLGHELFHCVQNAYPLFAANWEVGAWITEATAQALGQDLRWQLRRQEFSRRNPVQRWGGRPYHRPLATRDPSLPGNFHYYTESLWRYLGEQLAAKKRGGRAGVKEIPADYGYLHAAFERPLSGAGEAAELAWADEALEAVFGVGLDRLYPDFVSLFPSYVPERVNLSSGTSPEQAFERWVEYVYGRCATVDLDDGNPVAVVDLDLAPLAARCVTLRSSIADQVDVSLHTRSDAMRDVRSLVVGTADGTRVGQPSIIGSPTAGGLIASWTFRLGMAPPQTLIVSNVFEDVAETRAQRLSLTVSVNGWDSSLTEPAAEKPPSGARPADPGRRAVPDATVAAAGDRVATGLDALSAHAINGLSVGFNRDEPPCSEPFALGVCGPNLTINLSLAPGSVGGFEHVSGTGGALGQFLTTLAGVAEHGLMESSRAMSEAAETIRDTKGSTVRITLPAIDYGFAGSLEGVAIRVNGAGGDDLEAIEPRDTIPGPGRAFPSSGRVTIEEFTPFVLRGRFSAALVNTSRLGDDLGDDPVLEISDQVQGSFVIGAPWRGDDRAELIQTESPVELAMQDLAELMPLPRAELEALAPPTGDAAAAGPGAGTATGYAVAPMTPFPVCDCSCAPLENPVAGCRPVCEVAVRHCEALAALRAGAALRSEQETALTAATEGLRERFAAFMTSQGFDPAFQTAMLGAFDQQGTTREQRNFVRSMGMPLEQEAVEIDPEVQRVLGLTREEYLAELRAKNVRPELHAELLEIFDELKRREAAK